MDAAYDVPDSTDWLQTPLKDFADLENALHCQICKEFYDTPMITSCAHTFCSKCIRTSLSADGKCPACRTTDQASKLRNNWAIQEAVATFLAARTAALQVARQAQEQAVELSGVRKRKRPDALGVGSADTGEASSRTTRSKSRRLAASEGSQTDAIVVDDSDGDADFEPEASVLDDGLVECPLGCGKRMKIEAVDPHLDRCEEEQAREKRSKSRTPVNGFAKSQTQPGSRPLERINELNYSLLKDSAMTKKLNEIGIPSWGLKQLMINRHKEWVNLWNANCDSSNPRTKRELLQDLDVWERTQGGRAPNGNGLTNSIMRKDFDGAGWAKKNQDDFSRLIADARKKKHNPAMQPEPAKTDEASSIPQPSDSGNSKPYADDPEALISMREKVSAVNAGQVIHPTINNGFAREHSPGSLPSNSISTAVDTTSGDSTRFKQQSPLNLGDTMNSDNLPALLPTHGSQRVPMFAVPKQAFEDIDGATEGGEAAQ